MPASFPNSIFAPATIQTGDTLQPSNINDPNAEIIAIETGFRQGTAPLNSSGSTVTSLSVTGGSTLGALTAGASSVASLHVTGASTLASLQVTGGSTVGSLQVTGVSSLTNVVVSGAFTGVVNFTGQNRVALLHGSSQTLSTGVEVAVTFNTETYNIGSMHSTASNPTRILLTSSGDYDMTGTICFDAAGTGERYAYWRANGTTVIGTRAELAGQGSAAFVGIAAHASYRTASTTEYVELMAFTKDVAPLNNGGGTGAFASRAWCRKVG